MSVRSVGIGEPHLEGSGYASRDRLSLAWTSKAELFAVVSALDAAQVDYAVCGGFAVVIHGHPRLTQDIDLLVLDADLARARNAVAGIGYTLEGGEVRFDAGTRNERALWRGSKAIRSDVITIAFLLVGALFRDVWAARERFAVRSRSITVVSRDGLAKMKRAAARAIDLEDLSSVSRRRTSVDPEEMKRRSRGDSTDMSPLAIERRLRIAGQLFRVWQTLREAKRIGPVERSTGIAGPRSERPTA